MSAYALVHLPQINTTKINDLRDEHDPCKDLIDVHITMVFSVQVEEQALIEHIEKIPAGWNQKRVPPKRVIPAVRTKDSAPLESHHLGDLTFVGLAGYAGMPEVDGDRSGRPQHRLLRGRVA